MAKYIKRFETVSAQTQYVQSMNYIEPYISAVNDTDDTGDNVQYNQYDVVHNQNFLTLNYIQNTSTAYINTTYVPNINTKVEAQFMQTALTYTYPTLFGTRNLNTGTQRFYQHINSNKTNNGLCYGAISETTIGLRECCYINTIHTLIQCKDYVELDGVKHNINNITTINPTNQLHLFVLRDKSGIATDTYFTGRLYYCKISENGVLKQHWIPAKRLSDNIIGMYDQVRKTFYASANSTKFTGG